MSAKTPTVADGRLYDPLQPGRPILLDTPAWFAWLKLEQVRSFAYPVFDARCGYIAGYMTVRKEGRQRGGTYWTVYRRSQGRVRKVYLGTATRVTRERLVLVVRQLLAEQYQCAEAEIVLTQHH
ncbi:MAG TPA: hypothetical protein VLA19_20615 [Herpetosiphonaceae bacterium]|nr:hypothetical protein [Herpetosiphonaceae bacterium]